MVGFVLYASGRQISTVNVPAKDKALVREISVSKGPPLEAGERRTGWGDASGMLVGGAVVVSGVIAASTSLVKKRRNRRRTPDTDLSVVDELGKRWLHGFGRHTPEEAQVSGMSCPCSKTLFWTEAPSKSVLNAKLCFWSANGFEYATGNQRFRRQWSSA